MYNIFSEMTSDQKDMNWDGIGLGLPICLQLAKQNNYIISYGSIPSFYTVFQLYVPLIGKGSLEYFEERIYKKTKKERIRSVLPSTSLNELI